MLHILTVVLFGEACLALLLVCKIKPLVKTACLIVDLTKTTRGSAATKTLAATLIVLLASSVYSFVNARNHMLEHHGSNVHGPPAEYFLMRTAELESALSGFILFLALMINRVHYYLRKAQGLKLSLEVLKKRSTGPPAEQLKSQQSVNQTNTELLQLRALVEEIQQNKEKLLNDVQIKEKELKTSEANVLAIQKQSEGMRLEYERLILDNEDLRSQLSYLDRNRDILNVKKNT